jgi:methionyl-tRNA synthetase
MEDLDLNLQDFIARVNSDLIGKYVNIASRSAGFLVKQFAGQVHDAAMSHALLKQIHAASEPIATLYEEREFAKALRLVMELADLVNAFVDEQKPWDLAKDPTRKADLHTVCSVTLEAFRALSLYLKPVLPQVAIRVEQFLNLPPQQWRDIAVPLSSKNPIQPYQHLMGRVESSQIEALVSANQ